MHRSNDKLFNVLNRAYPKRVSEKYDRSAKNLSDNYEHCPVQAVPPFSFLLSAPLYSIIFNRKLSIDLFWLNGTRLLYILDPETGFQNSNFILYKSEKNLSTYFIVLVVPVNILFLLIMRLGGETRLTSIECR